jgi:hypothetical protein
MSERLLKRFAAIDAIHERFSGGVLVPTSMSSPSLTETSNAPLTGVKVRELADDSARASPKATFKAVGNPVPATIAGNGCIDEEKRTFYRQNN